MKRVTSFYNPTSNSYLSLILDLTPQRKPVDTFKKTRRRPGPLNAGLACRGEVGMASGPFHSAVPLPRLQPTIGVTNSCIESQTEWGEASGKLVVGSYFQTNAALCTLS